jgi:hypothetical protein
VDQHLGHGIRTKDDCQEAPRLSAIVFDGEDSNAQCDYSCGSASILWGLHDSIRSEIEGSFGTEGELES